MSSTVAGFTVGVGRFPGDFLENTWVLGVGTQRLGSVTSLFPGNCWQDVGHCYKCNIEEYCRVLAWRNRRDLDGDLVLTRYDVDDRSYCVDADDCHVYWWGYDVLE